MPCDEVRTVTLNLPNLDKTLMRETLDELGLRSLTYEDGKLTSSSQIREETLKKIKALYTKKAVRKVAKKHGWAITDKSENEMESER